MAETIKIKIIPFKDVEVDTYTKYELILAEDFLEVRADFSSIETEMDDDLGYKKQVPYKYEYERIHLKRLVSGCIAKWSRDNEVYRCIVFLGMCNDDLYFDFYDYQQATDLKNKILTWLTS